MDTETPVRAEYADDDGREERADLDLRRVAVMLGRRLSLMLAVFGIVLAIAAAVTWLMTPVYEAESTLLAEKSDTGAAASILGDVPFLGAALASRSTKTQELLLEHPDLTEKAARELGLLAPGQTVDDLEYEVQAESDSGSDLVMLRVQGADPGKAADLANRITDLFLKESRKLAQEGSHQAADYISGELKQMEKTLNLSEEKLREYQAAHGVADISASITASINRAAALGTESDTAASAQAGAQKAADYFRRKLAKEHDTYIASSTIARNPVVQKLEADLSSAQAERAAQSASHGPEYSAVKRLDKQIAELTAQLKSAMQTVIESQVESSNPVYLELAQQLAVNEAETVKAAGQEAALAALRDREMAQMREWPDLATDLGRLKRDAQVSADLYVLLTKNYQQMKINEAVASPGVQVVVPAKLPDEPVRPRKLFNMAFGMAVGVLLALLAAALAEAADDRMRTAEDVDRRLGLTALAVIPAARDMQGYLQSREDDAELADCFRALRTAIRFAAGGATPPAMLVTSFGPAEGKTSVAFGLGIALAQSGQRVLVVDADMRRTGASKRAAPAGESDEAAGLSAALAGPSEPLALVRRTGTDRLSFLPAGEVPPNPVELLDSSRAQETLSLLKTHFDAVIVDSPPCPAFVETVVAAAICDVSLVVVDATTTHARDAHLTVEHLAGAGRSPLGVILNRAPTKASRYYRRGQDAAGSASS